MPAEIGPARSELRAGEDRLGFAWPIDYVASSGLAAISFVILYVGFWLPPGKIFDEVYFARAAEEYLHRRYIYENTHPPVAKLLITLSTVMFGDNSYGWRFLDVVFGAVAVWLLYALLKRITGSTLFASYGTGLFMLDGMHFVQSRIATPESFVVCFALAPLYTFYRYWTEAEGSPELPLRGAVLRMRVGGAFASAVVAIAIIALRFPHESLAARIVAALYAYAGCYLIYRVLLEPRIAGTTPPNKSRGKTIWLFLFALSVALLVASKWYGVMACGVAFAIVLYVWTRERVAHRSTRTFALDITLAAVIFVTGTVYFASYTPQFIGLSDTPSSQPRAYTLTDVVSLQYNAFEYHAHLRATHMYQSRWWQWPLELRPILYYAEYGRRGSTSTAAMIYTLPNPLILWLDLVTVPFIAYLGIKERNKAYVLICLTYLAQWLPWMGSPRISFAYHFYVDIPLICACTAIAMQRLWLAWRETERRLLAQFIAGGYFAAVTVAFVYFYPILSGMTISSAASMNRMWLHSWI